MEDIKTFCPAKLPSVIGKAVEEYDIDATIEILKEIVDVLETSKEYCRKKDNNYNSSSNLLDKDIYMIYKKGWYCNEYINSFLSEEECLQFLKMNKLEYLYQLKYETPFSHYYYKIVNKKLKNAIDDVCRK